MMQTNGTSRETLSTGYRMDSIEWSGWGTFHHHWKMHLGGETTLLTGENGSGKSTILDMILTLLIPTVGRNYNQAAGGKKQTAALKHIYLGDMLLFLQVIQRKMRSYVSEMATMY
jgi:uncharacterized protein YPO0396